MFIWHIYLFSISGLERACFQSCVQTDCTHLEHWGKWAWLRKHIGILWPVPFDSWGYYLPPVKYNLHGALSHPWRLCPHHHSGEGHCLVHWEQKQLFLEIWKALPSLHWFCSSTTKSSEGKWYKEFSGRILFGAQARSLGWDLNNYTQLQDEAAPEVTGNSGPCGMEGQLSPTAYSRENKPFSLNECGLSGYCNCKSPGCTTCAVWPGNREPKCSCMRCRPAELISYWSS